MFDYKKKKDEETMKMSPMEQKAKLSVLDGMRGDSDKDLLSKLQGLKKVSVASNDPEGLKLGLEKAQELVSAETETPKMEHMESMTEGMSSEELQSLIDELLQKKGLLDQKMVKPTILP